MTAAQRRAEAACARLNNRSWMMLRRERTRQLIELGGLVAKAGLVALTQDDRAALYGAFLEAADQMNAADAATKLQLWRRRGQRAFAREAEPRA
jgi:hypothetical protein